jgi:hypothetical protein
LRRGNSSLQYSVKVFGEKLAGHDKPLFETNMSFVNVDVEGKPQSISDK